MFLELVLLVVTLYVILAIADNYIPSKNYAPGPFRLPILGNALTFLKGRNKPPFVLFRELNKKYGPLAYLRMGSDPTLLIDDFDVSKQLLNNEVWIDRPSNDLLLERSYGKPLGIIFVGGEGWREMRRFAMRILRDFGYGKQKVMQSAIDDEVGSLLESVEKVATSKHGILEVKHLFTMPVLNILWSMVSSVRTTQDEVKLRKLTKLVDNLTKATPIGGSILDLFPGLRHVFPEATGFTFMQKCFSELQTYFQELLESRRNEGVYKEDCSDFIDMFVKEIDKHEKLGSSPNHYTDEQFITVITDLFEAGSETSSNTLEFAIYYAMKNPRVQKKVQQEIDRVVGRSRLPSIVDRAQMPYTEATLIEVQRMLNMLPMTVRSPTEDCSLNGYFCEKGTVGIVNIYSIHMNKEFWGDPFVFRPERFLDENNQIITQKAARVIPLGAGKEFDWESNLRNPLCSHISLRFFKLIISRMFLSMINEKGTNGKSNLADNESDLELEMFQKWVHVGFTLSPNPYQTKLSKRS